MKHKYKLAAAFLALNSLNATTVLADEAPAAAPTEAPAAAAEPTPD